MKNICFVIRGGYDAKFIIAELNSRSIDACFTYIIEGGGIARRQKLKRMIRKQNIVVAFVNICALLIYDHIMLNRMKTICGHPDYPKECDYINVDDVNDYECQIEVRSKNPDLVLVYGSGILKAETIEAFGGNIYNIHSSILPYYRNVHSDFWAYMDNRKELIGVTVFKLESGIDTGEIAIQYRCDLPGNAKLHEYKAKNLENIPSMVEDFIAKFFAGQVILKPQDLKEGSVAKTPELKDIIHFFKAEGRA